MPVPLLALLQAEARLLWDKSFRAWLALLKVLLPTVVLVKLLQDAGLIPWVAAPLTPLMALLDLPPALGLVWATAMLNSIYGGLAVFATLAPELHLTARQATTLGILILLAHSLPVELQVARLAGARPSCQFLLRFLGAIALAWSFTATAQSLGVLQALAPLDWLPTPPDPSWTAFAANQALNLLGILGIICTLTAGMRLLDALGLTRLAVRLLAPLLRAMGIGPEAALITVAGTVLGLSYGSGLILAETASGRLTPRDTVAALSLMGLSHAVIEDTLLLSLIGGHASGLLWARLAFAFVVTAALTRIMAALPETLLLRWFARPPAAVLHTPSGCPHCRPPEAP